MNPVVARTETRIVRPFIGLELAEELTLRSILKIGNSPYSPGTIMLPAHKLKERGFILQTNFDSTDLMTACKSAGIKPKDVIYQVFASSRMLRVSTLIYEYSIESDKDISAEINIDDESSSEFDRLVFLDSTGFDLHCVITLTKSSDAKALTPRRVGTWISKCTFSVKPEIDMSSFAPEPLSDLIKSQFHLPKDAYSFVYLADNLLQADDLSEVVTVYLDSEILNLLLIDESDEVSKQMQASLVIQTIETVVHGISQSLRDDGQSISELSDEVGAFRFMAQLSSNLKVSMEEIIQFSLSNPAILRAKLESQFKIRTLNEQLLKGGQ
jgi:hypothetical protein